MKKISLIIVICVALSLALFGCQSIYDLWPVTIPKAVYEYGHNDPNKIQWPCLGVLKDLETQNDLHHVLTQAEVEYNAKCDNLSYSSVAKQATILQTQAEKEVQSVFGAGGLADIILTALAAGGGTAAILRRIWYTEKEHQKDKTVAVETALKIVNGNKPIQPT